MADWAASSQRSLYKCGTHTVEPPHGWIGAWGDDDLCFNCTRLEEQLHGWGFSKDEVIAGWKDRGWLNCNHGNKIRRRINKNLHLLYGVRMDALAEVGFTLYEGRDDEEGQPGRAAAGALTPSRHGRPWRLSCVWAPEPYTWVPGRCERSDLWRTCVIRQPFTRVNGDVNSKAKEEGAIRPGVHIYVFG